MIKIEYWNSCDLKDSNDYVIHYSGGFKNIFWRDVELRKPNYIVTQNGDENGDQDTIYNFQKWDKKYEFTDLCPEYLVDVYTLMQLHDNINISYNGETFKIYDFSVSVDWKTEQFAEVTIQFSRNKIIYTGCCENSTPCIIGEEIGAFQSIRPIPGGTRRQFLCTSENLLTKKFLGNIIKWDNISKLWIDETPILNEVFIPSETLTYTNSLGLWFWYNGVDWSMQFLNSLIEEETDVWRLDGNALPGTLNKLEYKLHDDTSWSTYSTYYGEEINSNNIMIVTTFFEEGTYDFRIICFNWGCVYPTTNILENINIKH